MAAWTSIAELTAELQAKQLTVESVVTDTITACEAASDFNVLISMPEKRALERARQIDKRLQAGETVGRLAGIPFIAKDNFLTYGGPTTAASNMLKNFEAAYQSTAIEKLETEGAICIGKSNLDAFAHGSSTENSDFMVTNHPQDSTRVPGGSSGGSAAAVALNLTPFAIGTDTGGSVRLPASFCGVVGYKPTYGLVSRSGVIAMASSTDVIGPITHSVEDSALILDIIAGQDKYDGTTIERDKESYTKLDNVVAGRRIGVVKEYFDDGLEKGVRDCIDTAIKKFQEAGATVNLISLPSVPLALAVYYVICPAEVSSNLARYDGQRYGYSSPEAMTLQESYEFSREQGFGAEAKRRIMIGTYVLSSGYYDAYYKKAQTVRTKLINEMNKAFENVDFLLGPTTPTTAFKRGSHTSNPLQMYMADIMTVAANITGVPSISIPAGYSQNLPVGLQLMAPQKHDRQLLGIAKACQELLT